MKKKIVLLGSTGSIGKSFLDILKKDKKNCDILLLSVNRNINELLKQLKIFKVRNIVVREKKSFLKIKKILKNKKINIYNNYDSIHKIFNKKKKELLLSDYNTLETKKLHAASQIAQEGASKEIDQYLSNFNFPSEESKRLTQVALLNYCGAAILMPYKLFHSECKKLKYDLELLQNTFATSFEQVAHRVTCLQDPKLPGIPFHMLRTDIAGNISKRFSLSGIEIPRYGGACPRWNVYSAFTRPGVIQAAVSKMTNGEKYVCIARTVEKGVGRYGLSKSILSIGLGCEAKYAKQFVYTENLDISDKKTEIPIGVSCRTCDRLDCSQRAFPPLHKKFDVDINSRGVSVYVNDKSE